MIKEYSGAFGRINVVFSGCICENFEPQPKSIVLYLFFSNDIFATWRVQFLKESLLCWRMPVTESFLTLAQVNINGISLGRFMRLAKVTI